MHVSCNQQGNETRRWLEINWYHSCRRARKWQSDDWEFYAYGSQTHFMPMVIKMVTPGANFLCLQTLLWENSFLLNFKFGWEKQTKMKTLHWSHPPISPNTNSVSWSPRFFLFRNLSLTHHLLQVKSDVSCSLISYFS